MYLIKCIKCKSPLGNVEHKFSTLNCHCCHCVLLVDDQRQKLVNILIMNHGIVLIMRCICSLTTFLVKQILGCKNETVRGNTFPELTTIPPDLYVVI